MKGLKVFVLIAVSTVAGLYLFWCFGLGRVLNSAEMISKYEKIISEKTGIEVNIENFKFDPVPDLSFRVQVGEISSAGEEISINNLKYHSRVLSFKPRSIDAKRVYFDYAKAKNFLPTDDKKNKNFDINSLPFPEINIDEIFVKLDEKNSIQVYDIVSKKNRSKIICKFVAKILSPYFSNPVYVGKTGNLAYHNNIMFNNLAIETGNSVVYLNDDITKLHITGENLSVPELERAFLSYYKVKKHGKRNFIENFTDFKGNLDVDVVLSKKGFDGKCVAHNLGADFSKFKIPVYLPKVIFNFKNREISAKTKGLFGPEPVYTNVLIEGVATKDLHVTGNVKSTLTNNFAQKYFPPVKISGKADASVKYEVKDEIVSVIYKLVVGKNSNLISKYGSLDLTDKVRLIRAHTLKIGEKIYLKKYNYSISNNGSDFVELLGGTGLFEKISGHYRPVKATVKTIGDIQISVIRSFIEDYLDTGRFNADINFNFLTKTLSGTLNLYDIRRNDFMFLKRVSAKSTGDKIMLNTEGTFFDSPITFNFDADSNFKKGLVVENIDIHLNRFKVKRGHIDSVKNEINEKKNKYMSIRPRKRTSDYPIEVKNGRIVVDEITHSKFSLHNVALYGRMKDKVVDFTLPETEYAKGLLSAVGKYNVENHSSDINFLASDIDSNEVVTNIFNLPDQFQGSAYATLHLITKNKLNDIKASATFAIEDGFLPKLGSREFVLNRPSKFKKALFFVNKPIKFTLSKICNIDFSKPNVFYSNLRGAFNLDNENVKDVKIFSESDNLSMFIEGNYNVDSQIGHLVIWGKRNKVADRRIKIFNIPLGLIYKVLFRVERSADTYEDKVDQIPPIKAEPYEISIFRVNADGNLNSNDIKLQFKDIRSGDKK